MKSKIQNAKARIVAKLSTVEQDYRLIYRETENNGPEFVLESKEVDALGDVCWSRVLGSEDTKRYRIICEALKHGMFEVVPEEKEN